MKQLKPQITEKGEQETRFLSGNDLNKYGTGLNGWDSECTLWLKWRFQGFYTWGIVTFL